MLTMSTAGGTGAYFVMKVPARERPEPVVVPRALDRRGVYRSPVTMPEYHKGKAPANKGKKYPPEPLRQYEVLALIDQCGKGPAGRRNRAMIVVMWRAGLRCSEMLGLYPKDIDLETGTVAVLHGKGEKSRIVGLDAMACSIVERWLQERQKLPLPAKLPSGDRPPLFCVISRPTIGRPVYGAYVRALLKQLAVKAGIEKRTHPHGLRHTHAFELAGERTDLRLIKAQLGHTSLAVTARYVEHLNPAEVVDAIRGRDWPQPSPPPTSLRTAAGAPPPALR